MLEKSNAQLESSEIRIRTLISSIPVGLFITTESGVIETISPTSLELFKCSYKDLTSRNLRELFLREGQSTDDLLSTELNQTKELTALRLDGSKFPASLKVTPFARSSVPGLLAIVEDVSAKHELDRLKQEFISMITHDLRTPLTSVQCFLSMVTEGVFDGREELLRSKAAGVESETARLIRMINSLLNLHKLEAGRLTLSQEVVMVTTLVNQSVQSIVALAESRAVPLAIMHIPDNLLVSADCDYTVQVLVNLLSNALKFSPQGRAVTVSVETQDEFVKIIVSDKGRGIPKELQSRLFNRFEQAELSDDRVKGGTGLGLAISKAIVEQQGGSIGVESEPGEGCVFWFTLPRETVD